MNNILSKNQTPIIGKTYSLYNGENTSDNFYIHLSACAEEIIKLSGKNNVELLKMISDLSRSKLKLRLLQRKDNFVSSTMDILNKHLSVYLINVEAHLKSISIRQLFDRRLSTSYNQYLLYMLEIELTNRLYIDQFNNCKIKLAFLPHCLHDLSRECLAAPDGIDYTCKGCSKKCIINHVGKILKSSGVIPYIWREADLKKVFTSYMKQGNSVGAFGIACIPELVFGMRLCRKHNIPVTGIPLDANRCRRWMGEFYENSVNINQLINMLINSK